MPGILDSGILTDDAGTSGGGFGFHETRTAAAKAAVNFVILRRG
jgi:hypothetical protein